MHLLIQILRDQILPIFLAVGIGSVFWFYFRPDIKSMSRLSFYILSPCLVYSSISNNNLPAVEFWRIVMFSVSTVFISGALAWIIGNILSLQPTITIALMMTCMFVNGGNYGLSLNLFAFGTEAMNRAIVYYLVNVVAVYSIGVFIASNGIKKPKVAINKALKVPAIYALLISSTLRYIELETPTWIYIPIDLLAEAAIPVMLLILGMQLAKTNLVIRWKWISLVIVVRLIIMPIIAIFLSDIFNLSETSRKASILEASMPTAVIVTVLSLEYDLEPELVTEAVFITTLISPLVLTPLIAFLQT